MLIVYDRDTLQVISITSCGPTATTEQIDTLDAVEVAETEEMLRVYDSDTIGQVDAAMRLNGEIILQRNTVGEIEVFVLEDNAPQPIPPPTTDELLQIILAQAEAIADLNERLGGGE